MGESLPGLMTPVPIALHSKRDAVTSESATPGVLPLLCQLNGCTCHDTCFTKRHWCERQCHSYIKSGRDTTSPIDHQGISRMRPRKVRGKCTTCFNPHSKVRLVAKIYEHISQRYKTMHGAPMGPKLFLDKEDSRKPGLCTIIIIQ